MNLEQSNPLVTVYIPTFNRVELLKRAVESVRQQTYQNLEIIIVDDCSTDGTHEYLKDISEQDSRIQFFLKEQNSGACVSRNIAIKNAKGEFITGLDDDDYFTLDRIEIFLKNWKNCLAVKGLFSRIALKKKNNISYSYHSRFINKDKVSAKDLLKNNYVGNQIFTRTIFLQELGGFDEKIRMWQDLECWYNLIKMGGYLKCVDCYTYIQDISHEFDRITLSNKDKLDSTLLYFLEKHNIEGLGEKYLKSHFFNYGYNEINISVYLLKFLDGFHIVDLIRFFKIILRLYK